MALLFFALGLNVVAAAWHVATLKRAVRRDKARWGKVDAEVALMTTRHQELIKDHAKALAFLWYLIHYTGMPKELVEQAQALIPPDFQVEVVRPSDRIH